MIMHGYNAVEHSVTGTRSSCTCFKKRASQFVRTQDVVNRVVRDLNQYMMKMM